MFESLMAATSLGLVMAGWAGYLATIPKNSVPKMPWASIPSQSVGMVLAIVAIAGKSANIAVALGGGMDLVMASLFLFLLTQRATPIGSIKVSVGDTLLPFTAKMADSTNFRCGGEPLALIRAEKAGSAHYYVPLCGSALASIMPK